MKNWTKVCQELAYARTGKVYRSGEWLRLSDRGMAVGIMASERGDLMRVLVLSMKVGQTLFERFREMQDQMQAELKEWTDKVAKHFSLGMTVQTIQQPSNFNYASYMAKTQQYGGFLHRALS